MGNISSSGGNGRRRNSRRRNHTLPTAAPPPPPHPPPPPPPSATEIPANLVFAAASPYPNHNPNHLYQYPGYYHPQPGTMPVPYENHHHHHHHYPPPPPPPPHPYHPTHPWTAGGRYTYGGPMMPPPPPYVEHQKAVTIRNAVNLKKETLKLETDPDNPGRFLVSFTFDATVSGR